MTLNDCTKAELLYVIGHLKSCLFSGGDYQVSRALTDIEYKREKAKLSEAKKLSDLSRRKMKEYIDLLSPYEGKTLGDVPSSVLKAAHRAMKEAKAADDKWLKLMGIPRKEPRP